MAAKFEDCFRTDDLTFTGAVLVLGKANLEQATFSPNKVGVKIFWLTPKEKVYDLYAEYVSGKLLVDPRQLAQKIRDLKYFPAREGGG